MSPGDGRPDLISAGGNDVFVSKLDSTGVFVWANAFRGTGNDIGRSVAVDSSGNVYTTGYFSGTVDFNPGAGTANLVSAGESDVFVSKLNSAGEFVWAKRFGGTGTEEGLSIAVDSSGNVYTTGSFSDTVDFNPGEGAADLTSSPAGWTDVFVSKLNSLGVFVRVGSTSVTIDVEAWARRADGDDLARVTEGVFTYVALGADRRARQIPK